MPKRRRSTKWIYGPPSKRIKFDKNIKFIELNDDCLREIFSYLPMKDLCAVSECSQRFRALAESTVETVWRNGASESCGFEVHGDSNDVQGDLLTLSKFGRSVTDLSIASRIYTRIGVLVSEVHESQKHQ